MISTLTHWAKAACFMPELLRIKQQYLHEDLLSADTPQWAPNKLPNENYSQKMPNTTEKHHTELPNETRGHTVIPYTHGQHDVSRTYVVNITFQE